MIFYRWPERRQLGTCKFLRLLDSRFRVPWLSVKLKANPSYAASRSILKYPLPDKQTMLEGIGKSMYCAILALHYTERQACVDVPALFAHIIM